MHPSSSNPPESLPQRLPAPPPKIRSIRVWRAWRLTAVSADRLWAHDEGSGKVVEEFFSVVRVLENGARCGWRVAAGRHLLYLTR